MKGLIEFIVRSLTSHPDAVEVLQRETENGVLLELKVHPDDMGTVIGRKGRTVNALRTVLELAAQKQSVRANLEILD